MTIPWSVRQTSYGDDYYVGSQDGTGTPSADKAAPPAPTDKAAAARIRAADAKADDKDSGQG